jgi:hypothetical protein
MEVDMPLFEGDYLHRVPLLGLNGVQDIPRVHLGFRC